MSIKLRTIALLFVVVVLCACARQRPEPVAGAPHASDLQRHKARDYGDLRTYQSCAAKARRPLTELEKCQIKVLSRDCTPAADCLVTCQSSPDGYKVGGGCYHICFNPSVGHSWEDRPPTEMLGECSALEASADITR